MEQWKPIPGYEGLYDASDQGRIRSTPGKTTSNARFDRRVWNTRIMKQKWGQRRGGKKDARVCLWKDGKEQTHLVARLVAMAWCGGYEEGLTVNHIDGNPENNRAENLEWVSMADNIRHAFDTGLCASFQHPIILNDQDGTAHRFRSFSEASRFLGRDHRYISGALRHNRHRVYSISNVPYTVTGM